MSLPDFYSAVSSRGVGAALGWLRAAGGGEADACLPTAARLLCAYYAGRRPITLPPRQRWNLPMPPFQAEEGRVTAAEGSQSLDPSAFGRELPSDVGPKEALLMLLRLGKAEEALAYAASFADLRSLLCLGVAFPATEERVEEGLTERLLSPFLASLDRLESPDEAQRAVERLRSELGPLLGLHDALFSSQSLMGDLVDGLRSSLSACVESLPVLVPAAVPLPRPLLTSLPLGRGEGDPEEKVFARMAALIQCLFAAWQLGGSAPGQLARVQRELLGQLRLAVKDTSLFVSLSDRLLDVWRNRLGFAEASECVCAECSGLGPVLDTVVFMATRDRFSLLLRQASEEAIGDRSELDEAAAQLCVVLSPARQRQVAAALAPFPLPRPRPLPSDPDGALEHSDSFASSQEDESDSLDLPRFPNLVRFLQAAKSAESAECLFQSLGFLVDKYGGGRRGGEAKCRCKCLGEDRLDFYRQRPLDRRPSLPEGDDVSPLLRDLFPGHFEVQLNDEARLDILLSAPEFGNVANLDGIPMSLRLTKADLAFAAAPFQLFADRPRPHMERPSSLPLKNVLDAKTPSEENRLIPVETENKKNGSSPSLLLKPPPSPPLESWSPLEEGETLLEPGELRLGDSGTSLDSLFLRGSQSLSERQGRGPLDAFSPLQGMRARLETMSSVPSEWDAASPQEASPPEKPPRKIVEEEDLDSSRSTEASESLPKDDATPNVDGTVADLLPEWPLLRLTEERWPPGARSEKTRWAEEAAASLPQVCPTAQAEAETQTLPETRDSATSEELDSACEPEGRRSLFRSPVRLSLVDVSSSPVPTLASADSTTSFEAHERDLEEEIQPSRSPSPVSLEAEAEGRWRFIFCADLPKDSPLLRGWDAPKLVIVDNMR